MRNLLFILFVVPLFSHAYASDTLQRSDLSQLAASANQEKLPILLIVSQHHCPFCVRLKEEIIYPMQLSGDYEDKVIIAEILLDSTNTILDLEGNSVMPGEIGNSYEVWVTPTLLFLDHTGREIHKRMLGVNTIEMYSYYLDESLAAALKAVRKGDQSYVPTNKDIQGDAPGFDQLY
ncbi:MAG: thioredoxin fold domain-containing protein [Candidatus Thiodiazotropha sp. (ex Codakia rugifera)]|nr:thioredoxin fold domain-containing protein [Candidatus Thiodiazotropha sp. (ex Codakia rugifera)]